MFRDTDSPYSLTDILETYKSDKTVGQNLATHIKSTYSHKSHTKRAFTHLKPILATRAEKPTV